MTVRLPAVLPTCLLSDRLLTCLPSDGLPTHLPRLSSYDVKRTLLHYILESGEHIAMIFIISGLPYAQ